MTKDIMLRISGVQFPDGEENSEEMEVITSGSYFEKDGRHYIKYDEVQEDSNEVIRNLLKIENGSLELTRRGMTNVHMVFEKDIIDVQVKYALEINSEYIADCSISICANSK